MSQSLVQTYLHIIFSTKDRRFFLEDKSIRERTHAYLGGICRNLKCPALIVGGVEDHVHLLTRHSKNITIANFWGNLKRESSKWIKTLDPALNTFYWQNGYGAFSMSPTHVENVKKYISNQEQHHRKESRLAGMNSGGYVKNTELTLMNDMFGINSCKCSLKPLQGFGLHIPFSQGSPNRRRTLGFVL
jgi:REP element-mobilizing transposase RayT